MTDFEKIFQALSSAQARFIVVGGVAVVLQGHPRFTADIDLVVALDEANAKQVLAALSSLGYRPRLPIPAEQFADSEIRQRWIDDTGLLVFSLWSDRFPVTEVDLFVSEPFPFEEMWARASKFQMGEAEVAVASIGDLIAMKEKAGRPKDLQDVAELKNLLRESEASKADV